MKYFAFLLMSCLGLGPECGLAQSADAPDFSPPPVPGFMLKAPDRPLSLEEMQKKAAEAAKQARDVNRKKPEHAAVPAKPAK